METSDNRTVLGVSTDTAQIVGNRLRRARESIGRSTSALSAKIKVREHYLVAIECGQWNELPPGLNGRGLVRIYARELAVSVPELDQAANPSMMPAEHDAQAPYQVNAKRESPSSEREPVQVRTVAGGGSGATRNTEASLRGNTLTPTQRQARVHDLPSASEKKRPAAPIVAFKGIESNADEEPLDVITPDVASILGITLDTLEERTPPKAQTPAVVFGSGSVERSVAPEIPIVAAPVVGIVVAEEKIAAPISVASPIVTEVQAVSEQPVSLPIVSEQPLSEPIVIEQFVSAPLVSEQPISEPVASEQPVASPFTLAQPTPVSSLATPPSTPPGVSAAEDYLRNNEVQETSAGADQVAVSKGLSQTTRWAMGLVAASVAALLVGQIFMRPETPSADAPAGDSLPNESAQVSSPVDPPSVSDTNSDSAGLPPEAVQSDSGAAPVSSQALEPAVSTTTPQGVEPIAATHTQTQPQPQPQGSVANVEASPVSAQAQLTTTETAPEAQATANSEEKELSTESATPGATPMSGSNSAVLTLSEPLEIQIMADGKRVYSGKHSAGKVEIKFNRRAEIFVQDGSKARLKYAGWDHGSLGSVGRKRRIVLNAGKFNGSAN